MATIPSTALNSLGLEAKKAAARGNAPIADAGHTFDAVIVAHAPEFTDSRYDVVVCDWTWTGATLTAAARTSEDPIVATNLLELAGGPYGNGTHFLAVGTPVEVRCIYDSTGEARYIFRRAPDVPPDVRMLV